MRVPSRFLEKFVTGFLKGISKVFKAYRSMDHGGLVTTGIVK